MFGNNLFVDELDTAKIEIMSEMFQKAKVFTKAKKALSGIPVQTKTWTSAFHNDYTVGGLKFEVYDNIGRTIGGIFVTYENQRVEVEFYVTRNKLRTYTDWINYIRPNIKKFYKEDKG